MKCPKCNAEINPAAILGKAGGKKSKRKITKEQQDKMQAAKKKKEGEDATN